MVSENEIISFINHPVWLEILNRIGPESQRYQQIHTTAITERNEAGTKAAGAWTELELIFSMPDKLIEEARRGNPDGNGSIPISRLSRRKG